MKTCRLAIVRASAGGGADVGGEDTDVEGAVGAEAGAAGFSACTRATIPLNTVPMSMAGGVGMTGGGLNRSFKAPKVFTKSCS